VKRSRRASLARVSAVTASSRPPLLVIAWLAISMVVPAAGAQTPAPNAAPSPPPPTAQPDYHPSMGDLMTMSGQPRHIKLGLAGQQRNWIYAGYELSELRNAFARIVRTIPKYQSVDTAQTMTAVTQAPLDALAQAIQASNASEFARAYKQLTRGCNACHQSLNHAAVVIKVPHAPMFPDQDFRPRAQ
jgi:hypothetical protein